MVKKIVKFYSNAEDFFIKLHFNQFLDSWNLNSGHWSICKVYYYHVETIIIFL